MKNKIEWTIGKGIGYGLKWIAIMGIIIALLSFVQFLFRFQVGDYDRPERYEEPIETNICPEGYDFDERLQKCIADENNIANG